MKKTALIFSAILMLLLSCMVVFVDFSNANPAPYFSFPQEAVTSPPSIVVYSPVQEKTYFSSQVMLSFSVIKPDAWYCGDAMGDGYAGDVSGNVTSVYYEVDGNQPQNVTMHDVDTLFNSEPPRILNFSINLSLPPGVHGLEVGVEADSYYIANFTNYTNPFSVLVVHGSSERVNFAVKGLEPKPVIVAPEGLTYNESQVPLVYSVDTSAASWVGYSLDEEANITLVGNTTLAGLSNGDHNVTVYAIDNFGNSYASRTISFTVAVPVAKQDVNSFPSALVAATSAIVAVILIAAFIFYLKRRRLVGSTHDSVNNESPYAKHSQFDHSQETWKSLLYLFGSKADKRSGRSR